MQEKLNSLLGQTRKVEEGYEANLKQLTGFTLVRLSNLLITGAIQDVKIERSGEGIVITVEAVED